MDSKLLGSKTTLPAAQLREIIDGKNIALIGNAESIFSFGFGEEIDGHDVVIRINKGYIKQQRAQGKKTTIWAGSYPLTEKQIISNFAPQICMWMTPKISVMPNYRDEFLARVFIHPEEIWQQLYQTLSGTRPTTGMMLINYLINYTDVKSLTLFGFDFFHSKTFYSHKLRNNVPHNFSSEEQMVQAMIEKNDKLAIRGYQYLEERS